jgi:hypothetical protein
MAKSEMTFSPKLHHGIRNDFHSVLPFTVSTTIAKYLGMPTQLGHSKKAGFNFIMDRINKKLKGWKERFLSFAAREILISVVIT